MLETTSALNLNLKIKPLTSVFSPRLNVGEAIVQYAATEGRVAMDKYFGAASAEQRRYVEDLMVTVSLNNPNITIGEVAKKLKDNTLEIPNEYKDNPAINEALDILFSSSQEK